MNARTHDPNPPPCLHIYLNFVLRLGAWTTISSDNIRNRHPLLLQCCGASFLRRMSPQACSLAIRIAMYFSARSSTTRHFHPKLSVALPHHPSGFIPSCQRSSSTHAFHCFQTSPPPTAAACPHYNCLGSRFGFVRMMLPVRSTLRLRTVNSTVSNPVLEIVLWYNITLSVRLGFGGSNAP